MIFAHCLQFFAGSEQGSPWWYVSEYINLTTFSGFFLAFGYVAWLAYLQRPYRDAFPRLLRNALRLLVAYLISAFAFQAFHESTRFTSTHVKDLMTFQVIPGWSEFLLSFALLMILILIFQPVMKRAGKWLVPVIIFLSILSSFVNTSIDQPLIASLFGRSNFALFPVLPYSLHFALGILLAQKPALKRWPLLLVSLIGTSVFIIIMIYNGMPSRFPPSLLWVVGSMLFLYVYYFFSLWLTDHFRIPRLLRVGRESLFYLLVSNWMIFSIKSSRFFILTPSYALGFFLATILIIYFISNLVNGASTPRQKNH